MASAVASRRLRREALGLAKDPPPGIYAQALETNILEWHYVLVGAADTPYEGGHYHGTLLFPKEFPMKVRCPLPSPHCAALDAAKQSSRAVPSS